MRHTRNDPEVIEGAVYEDRDKRAMGRKVRVERIYRMGGDTDYARCTVVAKTIEGTYTPVTTARVATVLLKRLRSRDYALIREGTSA